MEINQLLMRFILACEDADAKILKFDITGDDPIAIVEIEELGEGPVLLTYDKINDEWL